MPMEVIGQSSQVFKHLVIVQKESGTCIIEVLPVDRRSRRRSRRRRYGRKKKRIIPLPTIKEEEYEEMLEALMSHDMYMDTLNPEEKNALEKVEQIEPTNAEGDMANDQLKADVVELVVGEDEIEGFKQVEDDAKKGMEVIAKKKKKNRKKRAKKICMHASGGGRTIQVTLLFKGVLMLIMGVIAMAVMAAGWKDSIK